MSGDEGEKFFLHYWDFGDSVAGSETLEEYLEEVQKYANASSQLLAPLKPHFERAHSKRRFPGYNLFARDWGSCPSGTKSCTEIGSPDSCCSTSDTCIRVDDTGNGNVGCCPEGSSCGSSISDCDTNAGQTSCPESANKGCCIEGYACYDVGCVWASTQTTTTVLPVATVTSGRTSQEPSSTTSEPQTSAVAVASGGTTYTTTIENTVTETAPGTTSIGTVTAATTVTITESPSETTEVSTETEEEPSSTPSSTETAALPPARPTGSSDTSAAESATTTTPEPTPSDASCPTGFYMCSAHYLGGCCRVGRNCDTTSCPTSDSTDIVSNGVTIGGAGGVASSTSTTTVDADGSSAAAASTQGSCANGWFQCSENDGGGCCPQDYICGASCSATISGVGTQPKQAPSGAEAVRWAWGFMVLALGTGIGMVWL